MVIHCNVNQTTLKQATAPHLYGKNADRTRCKNPVSIFPNWQRHSSAYLCEADESRSMEKTQRPILRSFHVLCVLLFCFSINADILTSHRLKNAAWNAARLSVRINILEQVACSHVIHRNHGINRSLRALLCSQHKCQAELFLLDKGLGCADVSTYTVR